MLDPPSQDTALERYARRAFTRVQTLLEYTIALFLVLFSLLTLYNTGRELLLAFQQHQDLTQAISKGVDAVLFTVILLEVLNTILSRAAMIRKLQEFLVIGIFSAIRYGLELVAGAQQAKVEKATTFVPPSSREIVIDLVINAGCVLILVIALWFVKTRVEAPAQRTKTQRDRPDTLTSVFPTPEKTDNDR